MQSLLGALWNGSYPPHGYCLFWQPGLIWTHVIADALTAIAYFSIPVVLVTLVRRRRELVFGWVFWCFAAFILLCGLTHVLSIVTLWVPLYGLQGIVKALTAIASIATAVALWPLLPKALALPSSERLQAANAELGQAVAERDAALEQLRAQVAQREKAEAALLQSQKLEAVGQLTGGIAHDFNNLLQAVAGNLELIARKPGDPDKVVRWCGSALDAVQRGRSLTGQLLAFSRKQRLDVTSIRLNELVGGMKDLLDRAVAPLNQVKVRPIDPSWNVQADGLQLELAILNLAFNARDAMPDGGLLTISAERRTGVVAPNLPAGNYIALIVEDTGTGMAPEVLARAAEPFFTTKEPGKGTGMGLAMAFGVLAQSGGTLLLESEEGRGTRVTLLLREAAGEPARAVSDDGAADERIDLRGCAVLLIDDDPQVRSTLVETLTSAGAAVRAAIDGAEGLMLLRDRRPDLLVVDFAMPGMTGAEVVRQAHAIHPNLPVLMVTGFADSSSIDAIGRNGLGILKKPFDSHQLLREASALIAGRR